MYRTIYVEREVQHHFRVVKVLNQYSDAAVVSCDRYTEVFNRKCQDFRLQKMRPSLILARKHSGHILEAPSGYGVGGNHNFYFSTMLNCLYDCRYCFLQGMYRSANHVIFVNYEDYAEALQQTAAAFAKDEQVWFFSGYDCDSLALEPLIGMADHFLNAVASSENAWLELRTKSTQIRSLLNREPLPNVVVAFSFTPAEISRRLEYRVPSVDKRAMAMAKLQERGWLIGLRFDPLIFTSDFRRQYANLFQGLISQLNPKLVHSVSTGVFRLPKNFYRTMERLYPDDAFIAQSFVTSNGQVSYPLEIESEMKDWCYVQLKRYFDADRIYFAENTPQDPVLNSNASIMAAASG